MILRGMAYQAGYTETEDSSAWTWPESVPVTVMFSDTLPVGTATLSRDEAGNIMAEVVVTHPESLGADRLKSHPLFAVGGVIGDAHARPIRDMHIDRLALCDANDDHDLPPYQVISSVDGRPLK